MSTKKINEPANIGNRKSEVLLCYSVLNANTLLRRLVSTAQRLGDGPNEDRLGEELYRC